jgi:two-component SAPR family response regulator
VEALGPGRVRRGGEEIPLHDWGYRQARELFFFLFFHGPASKAQVGECFWPGRRKRALSRVFHVALHYVRQALGDGELLVYRDGRYSWNPAAPVWCDAQEFAALLDRADLLPAGDPRAVPLLQEALRLYHGDFLAEFAGPCWTAYREELAGRQVRALLRLGNLHLDAGRSVAARRCFLQVLERDTLREEACQGLLLSYRQSGDETAARRAYEQFRRRLWQERRREPWPATAALVGPKPS